MFFYRLWHVISLNFVEQIIIRALSQMRKEFYIHLVAVIGLIVAIHYILWRALYTLNTEALWFSIPLLLAEIYGISSASMYFFMVWRPTSRTSPPISRRDRTVDIFITTYNEDLLLLRKTILGAMNVTYPHKTYVLDDGNRPEVARLAEELGALYIAREKNTNAKAGNLNNALKHTNGEFIVTLDADHIPLPNFIDKLLGYFEDEEVCFVQTPQDFYNLDSFQHRFDSKQRRLWTEQSLFFSVIQSGKDYWNAAFYCGSCAIMRRGSLVSIGGFAEGTITEDIHTSLRLHAKGFKSIYHNESLAYGVAAQTVYPFYIQRLRWGQGAMQVMRRDNPLTLPGLTPAQRVCYFASMTTYFDGFQKLIYYISPPVYFLTGVLPINALDRTFLIHFIPYLALFVLSFELMSRGHGSTLLTEEYNMSKFYVFVKSATGLFAKKRLKFNVTPKVGSGEISYAVLAPQLAIMSLNMGGVIWAVWGFSNGGNFTAFYGNLFWAAWNIGLAAVTANYITKKIQNRQTYRFPYLSTVTYKAGDKGEGFGIMRDYNEYGLSLLSWKALETGTSLRLGIGFYGGAMDADGVIVNVQRLGKKPPYLFHHGVRFLNLSQHDRDRLVRHGIEFVVPRLMSEYNRSRDFFDAMKVFWVKRRRKAARFFLSMPAALSPCTGTEHRGATEDFSSGGMSILCLDAFPNQKECGFTLKLPDREVSGRAKTVRCERMRFGGLEIYKIALNFVEIDKSDLAMLLELSRAAKLSPL